MKLIEKIFRVLILLLVGVLIALLLSPTITIVKAENILTPLAVQPTVEPLQVKDGCIQPLETFAYSIAPDESKARPGISEVVLPTSPWYKELQLDTSSLEKKGFVWLRSKVMGTRVNNGSLEVWVGNIFAWPKGKDIDYNFFQTITIYSPYTKKSKNIEVNFKSNDGISYYVDKLFFARDGSVWGSINANTNIDQKSQSVSILSKFDESSNSFKSVGPVEDIPIDGIPSCNDNVYCGETIVEFDGESFWFIVGGDAIYKYDFVEKIPKKIISIKDFSIVSTYLDLDNGIYLLTYNPHLVYESTGLSVFTFADSKITPIHLPTELAFMNGHASVFVDNHRRLWLDNDAWMDENENWFRLIDNPIFITNYAEDLTPRFRHAQVVKNTQDGRLWFTGDNGSAWLDIEKKVWCWYTTYQVTPYEDIYGRKWVVAGKGLYYTK